MSKTIFHNIIKLTILKGVRILLIGYARVSKLDQNMYLQLDELTKAGCIKIFEEKISGKNRERPELENLLQMLRPGDTVIVYKLDRIGRSMKHLIELMEFFNDKEVNFISLKENIDTSTATGRMLFHIMAALAQFEREMIVERTQSGIEAARARGRNGGRPKKEDKDIKKALQLYDSKLHSVSEIEKMTGVSASTLYRRLKQRK